MRGKATRIGVGLVVALLFAVGLALAKTVRIEERAKLADGPMLEPGYYKVEIAGETKKPEVDFYRDGHLVARAPAKLEPLTRKAPYTAVYYNNAKKTPLITGIELGGSRDKWVFKKPESSGHGGN